MKTVADIKVGDEIAGHVVIDDTVWTNGASGDLGEVPPGHRPFRFRRIDDGAERGFVMEFGDSVGAVADTLLYVNAQRPVKAAAPESH